MAGIVVSPRLLVLGVCANLAVLLVALRSTVTPGSAVPAPATRAPAPAVAPAAVIAAASASPAAVLAAAAPRAATACAPPEVLDFVEIVRA